jgi:cell division protein ZipA
MDIKDFILIGGGLLIAAVVAHGFWIAWRDRRQDLRIDIKPDLIPDEVDDMTRLKGELPNGGGRVVKPAFDDPLQDQLDLDVVPQLSLEPTEAPPPPKRRIEPDLADRRHVAAYEPEARDEPARIHTAGETPRDAAPVPVVEDLEAREAEPIREQETQGPEIAAVESDTGIPEPETRRATVAEVAMPEPIVPDEPRRPRRPAQRKADVRKADARKADAREAGVRVRKAEPKEPATTPAPVEELIVMNVLAEPSRPYTGDELFTALKSCGLKFGDMNIFHRVEPLTKAVNYSIASAVEPGTFDLSEMESIRCPGLCLFMQLPGPEDPSAAFEEMLTVARSVVKTLGGEVKDEHRNVMTPQTVEHYRQRIIDFSRRRMSKRA